MRMKTTIAVDSWDTDEYPAAKEGKEMGREREKERGNRSNPGKEQHFEIKKKNRKSSRTTVN